MRSQRRVWQGCHVKREHRPGGPACLLVALLKQLIEVIVPETVAQGTG